MSQDPGGGVKIIYGSFPEHDIGRLQDSILKQYPRNTCPPAMQ
jgi:hypothetical protein